MRLWLCTAVIFGCPSLATAVERIACEVSPPCPSEACINVMLSLSFTIDDRQFVAPIQKGEPPRKKVTAVTLGERSFDAEPILMDDGTRGFWATDESIEHFLILSPDGSGRYTRSDWEKTTPAYCTVS